MSFAFLQLQRRIFVIEDLIYSSSFMEGVSFDLVCGVPYTALPMATILSQKLKVPMIICRKEQKSYGTMNQVDGKYSQGMISVLSEKKRRREEDKQMRREQKEEKNESRGRRRQKQES